MALHIQRYSRSTQSRFQQLDRYSMYLRSSVVALAIGACMRRIEMVSVILVKMGILSPISTSFRLFVPNRSIPQKHLNPRLDTEKKKDSPPFFILPIFTLNMTSLFARLGR